MENKMPVAAVGVEGHLSRAEATYLYNIPGQLGEGVYVDLGTFKGRSAILLAAGLKDRNIKGKVITVDTFDARTMTRGRGVDTYTYAVQKMKEKEVDHLIEIYKGTTLEAAQYYRSVVCNFVFVDADHSYEAVRKDAEAWKHLLRKESIMAFHDSNTPGVAAFLSELRWAKLGQVETLSWWGI